MTDQTSITLERQIAAVRSLAETCERLHPDIASELRAALTTLEAQRWRPIEETLTQEIARLQREIGERQLRLQRLVCGDPRRGVHVPAAPPETTT